MSLCRFNDWCLMFIYSCILIDLCMCSLSTWDFLEKFLFKFYSMFWFKIKENKKIFSSFFSYKLTFKVQSSRKINSLLLILPKTVAYHNKVNVFTLSRCCMVLKARRKWSTFSISCFSSAAIHRKERKINERPHFWFCFEVWFNEQELVSTS